MPKTVLLTEDNFDARHIHSLLLRQRGFRVIEATNGADAVEMARSEHPDLILLDIVMPVMDGIEAARILKSDPETASIPLIATTAQLLTLARQSHVADLFVGYMTKPFNPSVLVSEVVARLGVPTPPEPEIVMPPPAAEA